MSEFFEYKNVYNIKANILDDGPEKPKLKEG